MYPPAPPRGSVAGGRAFLPTNPRARASGHFVPQKGANGKVRGKLGQLGNTCRLWRFLRQTGALVSPHNAAARHQLIVAQALRMKRNSRARIVLGVGGKARCSAVRPRDVRPFVLCDRSSRELATEEARHPIGHDQSAWKLYLRE